MDLYQSAVWNELKNTMKLWDAIVSKLENPLTAATISKKDMDMTRYKINSLMSKLDQEQQGNTVYCPHCECSSNNDIESHIHKVHFRKEKAL